MTAALIVVSVVAVALLGFVVFQVGVAVGIRRGIAGTMEMLSVVVNESAEPDARVEAYLEAFGGRIDAGRRGEN